MDARINELVDRIVVRYKQLAPGERIIVGVAGVPGAGKSTLAFPLVDRINERLGRDVPKHAQLDFEIGTATPGTQENQIAVSVSLDGWHNTREELDNFPDPAEARRRRGAAFTFDVAKYTSFVLALRQTPLLPTIPFRTFSHAKRDPEEGPFPITPAHKIVVIEGLYVLVNEGLWRESVGCLDERVWVDCSRDVARSRLIARHVSEGIEPNEEAAQKRVDGSDMNNGEFIRENLAEPTFVVESIYDSAMIALGT
ncbi:kinase-related protein [Pseudohyphozyma bogoriensis]|nr:kinase-related protein [Pseudohyphozyma bogoriensis]